MPRQSRGPHLYPNRRANGETYWFIRDGKHRESTGCHERDAAGARQALADYIGRTARPTFGEGDPARVQVAAVIALYASDVVPGLARPAEAAKRLMTLNAFLGGKTVSALTPSTCKAYVRWRTHQGRPKPDEPVRQPRAVQPTSARRELGDLQAAVNYAHRDHKLTHAVKIDMPDAALPRERWLTRSEYVRLLWACLGWSFVPACEVRTRQEVWLPDGRRSDVVNRHLARFVMIGALTATRYQAILSLAWMPHVGGGWADLDRGMLYRRAEGTVQTNKRKPPAPLPPRLMRAMRRWRRLDRAKGHEFIVSWQGAQITKLRRSFDNAVSRAGLDRKVTPHILKHTCITWQLHAGVSIWEVAQFAGTSAEVIQKVYGHHVPGLLTSSTTALDGHRRRA